MRYRRKRRRRRKRLKDRKVYLTPPKIKEYSFCVPIGKAGIIPRPEACSGAYEALLVSERHFRRKVKDAQGHVVGSRWNAGGPFYCVKHYLLHSGEWTSLVVRNGVVAGTYTVKGVKPCPLKPEVPAVPDWPTKKSELSMLYATGYARTRPGNPVAGVGQFLVELRDLPSIPFRQLFSLRRRKELQFDLNRDDESMLKQTRKHFHKSAITKAMSDAELAHLKTWKKTHSDPLMDRVRYVQVPVREVPSFLYNRLIEFRHIASSLGGEFLNYSFGWKPFVNDVRKMYNLWYDIDKRMAQIIRENGKGIRRRATIEETKTTDPTSETKYGFAFGGLNGIPPNHFGSYSWNTGSSTGSGGRSIHTVDRFVETKSWFVASFQYYIPDVSSSQWNRRARLALFGALPTPEMIYSVLPWSWLLDWFSNTGDVISNLSTNAVDNLTTKYSFVMKHTREVTTARAWSQHEGRDTNPTSGFRNFWLPCNENWHTVSTVVTKARVGGGNPFGLSVKLSDLTGHQLGILAALGLSRSSVK